MSDCVLVTDKEQLNRVADALSREEIIACDLEASELDIKTAQLEGIGIGTSQKQYFIPFPNGFSIEDVSNFLERVFVYKYVVFHNAKYDLEMLQQYKLPWPEKFHDTMIMSWLVDENNQHGLKPLAKSILGREPKKWSELTREQSLFTDQKQITKELADYCGDDVANTYDLYFHFSPILKSEGLMVDYEKVELPLIRVLIGMETRGVKLDKISLDRMGKTAANVLSGIESHLKEKMGENIINIHSPQQLEHLLFDIMRYPPSKVTDAGKRSTDDEVLNDIVKSEELGEDDFIPLLLKFRDLDKLYRTYMIGLGEQVDKEDIIHTHFLQHGTKTGRLACNEPNLQNIPSRNDEWNIRHVFIPREGYTFILADYSQIELRMLAHFSQDANMVETFRKNGDIHAKTMELTGTDRRQAKEINFGLIYGMGARTLAHTLNIKEEDAKLYIDRFFRGYPQVGYYTQRVQQLALREGYIQTLIGRRRRFNEVKDKRWYGMIARQAINSKIQGSAADFIKVAMIKLDKVITPFDAHLLLQIHDEVVIEVPTAKAEEVQKVVIDVMENTLKLRVPVKVNVKQGDRWIKD